MKKTPLQRLIEDADFPVVQSLVAYLRSQDPRMVPTAELALALGRQKTQVYLFVKKAKKWLRLTTGEVIANVAKKAGRAMYGYRVTKENRAMLFESAKSGNRADGHLAEERNSFALVDPATIEENDIATHRLYINQQARIHFGDARRAISRDTASSTGSQNRRLMDAAKEDSKAPWEQLGLAAPLEPEDDD